MTKYLTPTTIMMSIPTDLSISSYQYAVSLLAGEGNYVALTVPPELWEVACEVAKSQKPPPWLTCLPRGMARNGFGWCITNGLSVVYSDMVPTAKAAAFAAFAALTPAQIASCTARGVPLPPADATPADATWDGRVFEWRAPAEGVVLTADTPACLRWAFRDDALIAFMAYGWHARSVGYGRGPKDPEWGYSILPAALRDEAAKELL